MKGKSRMLGIMTTGGGKSLTFILLMFCSDSEMTIIMMPLIALKQDMTRRCRGLKIKVRMWE